MSEIVVKETSDDIIEFAMPGLDCWMAMLIELESGTFGSALRDTLEAARYGGLHKDEEREFLGNLLKVARGIRDGVKVGWKYVDLSDELGDDIAPEMLLALHWEKRREEGLAATYLTEKWKEVEERDLSHRMKAIFLITNSACISWSENCSPLFRLER